MANDQQSSRKGEVTRGRMLALAKRSVPLTFDGAQSLALALQGALLELLEATAVSETAATKSTMNPENFIQAALNISAERRKGYERREHGDIVNKRCADDLETLCQEYLSRSGER